MRHKILFGISVSLIALFVLLMSNSFSQTTSSQNICSDEDLYNSYIEDFISLGADQPGDIDLFPTEAHMGPPPGIHRGEMPHEPFMGPPPPHHDKDITDDMFFLEP